MSQENVKVVRWAVSAFDQGLSNLRLDVWDEECELVPAMAGTVEADAYRGHAGLRRYSEEMGKSFSEVHLDDREYRDLGERVLVLYRLRVRGHDSGVVLDQPGAALYGLRDGKIVNCRSYLSRRDAFEAAGLEE